MHKLVNETKITAKIAWKTEIFQTISGQLHKNHKYLIWKFINLVNFLLHAPPSHPHDTRHAHKILIHSRPHKIMRTHKKFLQKFPVTLFFCVRRFGFCVALCVA